MTLEDFWYDKKILVTGGAGFIGSHVVDNLLRKRQVKKRDIVIPRSKDCDLRIFKNCQKLMRGVDIVFHLAADVGGIAYSRTHPATQYYNCALMDLQLMEAACKEGVEKIVLVSCTPAYPAGAKMPLREDDLFGGMSEDTHFGFGFAKRTMIVLAQVYSKEFGLNSAVVVANNTYGPRDDFDPETSHVIPALIRKCFEEKRLVIWGDGSPKRDFIYVKDLVEGIILAAEKLNTPEPMNLSSGKEISIKNLVSLIVELTDFKGKVVWDVTKPKGQLRRSVDITKAKKLLGFKPDYPLEKGLKETIEWYREYGKK